MPTRTHYEVLDINAQSSQGDIREAFKRKVRQHPPEQDQEGYRRIREAYDVLSNPVSRKEYDNLASFGEEIEVLLNEAEDLMHRHPPDYEGAIKRLKKAIILGPDISMLRNMLGLCYLYLNNYSPALKQFSEAISLDENNKSYWMNKAYALEQLDSLKNAENIYRRVWQEDKEDFSAPRSLASLLFHSGRKDEAYSVLDEVIDNSGGADFENFLCHYDKLHFYAIDKNERGLSRELKIIKQISQKNHEREYASFMLGKTGIELFNLRLFCISHQFIKASKDIFPSDEDEDIVELYESTKDLCDLEKEIKRFDNEESINDLVRYTSNLFIALNIGEIDTNKEFDQKLKEVLDVYDNSLNVDPESSDIKSSIRLIRRRLPVIYGLSSELYDAILEMPPAEFFAGPCPYCYDTITNQKANTGPGTCPYCTRDLYFNGSSYVELADDFIPSGSSQRSTYQGSSSGATTHRPDRSTSNQSGGDCFVATAVYGDYGHDDVVALRKWRDQTLKQYLVGRIFIHCYYLVGPKMAAHIKSGSTVASVVRGILSAAVRLLPVREG